MTDPTNLQDYIDRAAVAAGKRPPFKSGNMDDTRRTIAYLDEKIDAALKKVTASIDPRSMDAVYVAELVVLLEASREVAAALLTGFEELVETVQGWAETVKDPT